jgi:AraC-like DNA-binding protein
VKPQLRPFYRLDYVPDRFFTKEDAACERLLDIFRDADGSPCLELEAISALTGLFSWIIKEERYQRILPKSKWSSSIKPCLEYIEAHYGDELSLDVLADVAGMNSRYFCKVFYSLTHTTPMNYVNFYRIEQAALLLELSELSVTEIAQKCGFWESSYFTKVFKKYKNTTPKQYRTDKK